MQQINLYHASLAKQKHTVSFAHLAQISLVFIVLLALFQAYTQYQLYSAKNLLKQQTIKLTKNEVRLKSLQARLPQVKKDLSLKSKLSKLEKDLISKQQVLNVLSEKKLGNTDGFTKQFEGLARQKIKGLWLTKLHFLQGGTLLDIHGKTLKSALVPQYLHALSSEAVFNGTEFNSFIIYHKDIDKALDFKFSNLIQTGANQKIELSSR